MDEETREHLESLHRSVGLLSENIDFILKMDEQTLKILVRLAYILERVANSEFKLPELTNEPSPEQIEAYFREIRALFDKQRELMQGRPDGDRPSKS